MPTISNSGREASQSNSCTFTDKDAATCVEPHARSHERLMLFFILVPKSATLANLLWRDCCTNGALAGAPFELSSCVKAMLVWNLALRTVNSAPGMD